MLFRQRFGDIPAGRDGLVALGVVDGKVASLSSSLATDTRLTGAVSVSAEDAVRAAANAAGRPAGAIGNARQEDGWTVFDVAGYSDPARVRLVGVPTPADGVRQAYEVLLMDLSETLGAMSYVDAATTELLVRDGIVDHAADNPAWKVFPASPPLTYASTDTREIWCWTAAAGCAKAVANPSSPVPWDVDAVTGTPTFQTRGNNARATDKWNSNTGNLAGTVYSSSPTRDYVYPWTNQWFTSRCNPASFTSLQQNDIDAARANLHAMHNRMHDWSYVLGFTETAWNAQAVNFGNPAPPGAGDPEHGNAQAGGVVGGPPTFPSRDNANQFSPADGVVPVTNMFLWQPIPATFYSPCVDGDYDMSVIAHEYGHLVSNRMVAGPNLNLSGNQPQAMGESWSDLQAAEFLNSQALVPIGGENPFAVGPYVTGDHQAGFATRDERRARSTTRTSVTTSPATRRRLHPAHAGARRRRDLVGDELRHPPGVHQHVQRARSRPATSGCSRRGPGRPPGDAVPGQPALGAARVRRVAADGDRRGQHGRRAQRDAVRRHGPVRRSAPGRCSGTRSPAADSGRGRPAPAEPRSTRSPSFESPHANNATVTFKAVGQADGHAVELFVGRYEAAANPIADTDPATPLGATFKIVPGEYEFVARGNGFGMKRFSFSLNPGQVRDMPVNMSRNVASSTSGATASGDGVNLAELIDDTEETNWASLTGPVGGKQVTVRLDPSQASHQVRRVQVSAMLRVNIGDPEDNIGQNRFTALRSFELWTCEATSARGLLAGRAVHADLHQRGRRVPVGRAAAARTGADHALVRRSADEGDARSASACSRTSAPAGRRTRATWTTIRATRPTATRRRSPASTSNDERVRIAELQVFEQ